MRIDYTKKKGYSLLRKYRVSVPGRIYHLRASTLHWVRYFENFQAARSLIQVMANEEPNAKTIAYCVMPHHLHWVIELQEGATLPRVMEAVKSVSCRRINRILGRKRGSIWLDGYFARGLHEYDGLDVLVNYVLRNPLRAGLVKSIWNYPHWDAKRIPEWVLQSGRT